ncbi:Uncharacterised protein [Shigella sonnei]|nr:Uncharacterised protein [Shigella sonnei]CSG00973.1 Uncharacterised protein [Shigella sonnei]
MRCGRGFSDAFLCHYSVQAAPDIIQLTARFLCVFFILFYSFAQLVNAVVKHIQCCLNFFIPVIQLCFYIPGKLAHIFSCPDSHSLSGLNGR